MLTLYPDKPPAKGGVDKRQVGPCQSPVVSKRGNQIYLISLGCPRNRVDTEVMLGILLRAGYEVAKTSEEADYTIINTCGFLKASREESLEAIGDVLAKKKEGARVIVAGCMVQGHRAQIEEHYQEIDFFLGSGDVEAVLEAIEAQEKGARVTSAQSYLQAGEVPRRLSTPTHYAYLKIAEGCRKRCAYCIIPTIKGKLRSKPLERIAAEFRLLLDQGVKEVILIAQDLGDWGKDLGYRRSEGLLKVLRTLLKDKRPFWLRLLYLYPDEISSDLIDLIKSDARICRYLDMPIQHIEDRILKAMHRSTTREQICRVINILRDKLPEVAIRTSLIVGFPGETEREFEALTEFVRDYALDEVGIFQYSREPKSVSFSLPNQIDASTKKRRQEELFLVQQKRLKFKLRSKIGKTLCVLIEGYHPDSSLLLRGRHEGQCPDIDSEVILNCSDRVEAFGDWYPVTITDIAGYDLVGHIAP